MQPAPTRPAVSSVVVLRGGLAVVSNVQTWTNAQMGHICAATMLTVSTPWALIDACARMDSLEMDSLAQIAMSAQRTATCVKTATV